MRSMGNNIAAVSLVPLETLDTDVSDPGPAPETILEKGKDFVVFADRAGGLK